jgi:hypothetical protein
VFRIDVQTHILIIQQHRHDLLAAVDFGNALVSDNDILYVLLVPCQMQHPLFDRALADQTVHRDLSSLTDSMSSVHGLRVVRGVPVVFICVSRVSSGTDRMEHPRRLTENDGIGGCQIDTETSCSSTEHEYEDIRAIQISNQYECPQAQPNLADSLSLIGIDHISPLAQLSRTIQPHVTVLSV